jgi:hypothetical protein
LLEYLQTLELRVSLPDVAANGVVGTCGKDECSRLSPMLAENAADVLVAPTQRRRHVALRPGLVPVVALSHYVVVFAVMRLVDGAVTSALRSGMTHYMKATEHAVSFTNEQIVASIKTVVASVCAFDVVVPGRGARWQSQSTPSEVLALRRPFRSRWLLHETDARLRQTAALVTGRLCDAAAGAQSAAAAVGCSVPRFRPTYDASRSHGQNVLSVSSHALDPACHAFLELCVRICAHFEEAWPLPAGVVWALPSMRDSARSARRHESSEAS